MRAPATTIQPRMVPMRYAPGDGEATTTRKSGGNGRHAPARARSSATPRGVPALPAASGSGYPSVPRRCVDRRETARLERGFQHRAVRGAQARHAEHRAPHVVVAREADAIPVAAADGMVPVGTLEVRPAEA